MTRHEERLRSDFRSREILLPPRERSILLRFGEKTFRSNKLHPITYTYASERPIRPTKLSSTGFAVNSLKYWPDRQTKTPLGERPRNRVVGSVARIVISTDN